jgi:hypothetical protein
MLCQLLLNWKVQPLGFEDRALKWILCLLVAGLVLATSPILDCAFATGNPHYSISPSDQVPPSLFPQNLVSGHEQTQEQNSKAVGLPALPLEAYVVIAAIVVAFASAIYIVNRKPSSNE